MAATNFPPPPANAPYDDFRSPAWQSWFGKVGQTLTNMYQNKSNDILESNIFGRKEPIKRTDLDSVDSTPIIASQIFGS